MSKKIRLVIDSVIEDRIRILTTTEDDKKKTIDIGIQVLLKILGPRKRIIEGRSYLITFENSDDYNILVSETKDKKFKLQGKIRIKDTTRQDKAAIIKLQKKLGMRA
ncbi:MAG: hypothetical protein L6N96_00725 [Candidatus Methylarchaceae archaeon HK02M2]|nr:hypothetical protein [Candidatus Methylarchaceae archaeon HK02M2]